MWYKNLKEIEDIENQVKNMNPYETKKHFDLMTEKAPPKELLPDDLDERLGLFYEMGNKSASYLSVHPQIYLYPSNQTKTWRYLLFDPKHLKRMENDDYHENLTTQIPISVSPEKAIHIVHKMYPTALIDYYESEEEMLKEQ